MTHPMNQRGSGPYARYQSIMEAAKKGGSGFLYEAPELPWHIAATSTSRQISDKRACFLRFSGVPLALVKFSCALGPVCGSGQASSCISVQFQNKGRVPASFPEERGSGGSDYAFGSWTNGSGFRFVSGAIVESVVEHTHITREGDLDDRSVGATSLGMSLSCLTLLLVFRVLL